MQRNHILSKCVFVSGKGWTQESDAPHNWKQRQCGQQCINISLWCICWAIILGVASPGAEISSQVGSI